MKTSKKTGAIYLQKISKVEMKEQPQAYVSTKITDSKGAANVARLFWDECDISLVESFAILCVATNGKPVCFANISTGGLDFTAVDVRVIFTHAILSGGTRIILFHNHPSGELRPSEADRRMTEKIKMAGKSLDIGVIDHIILSPCGGYYSFLDEGIL